MYPIIKRMPKSERHVLSQHIRHSLLDIAKMIVEANKSRRKLPVLYRIDVELEKLRLLIRLAKDVTAPTGKPRGLLWIQPMHASPRASTFLAALTSLSISRPQ